MNQNAKLTGILDPTRNSFNLVRLLAALSVIFSHSFLIPVAPQALEPLATLTPFNLSQHAVNAFFVLSGLTLAQSIVLKPHVARFAIARVLRIVPALVGYGIVFAFIIGPIATTSPMWEYWVDLHTWIYAPSVLLFFQHAMPPHGIFTNVPLAGSINNPLWTIKYEIFAYIALGVTSLIGILRSRDAVILSVAILFGLLVVFNAESDHGLWGALYQVARFGFCFMMGVLAYFYRERVPVSFIFLPITLAVAFALRGTILEKHAFILLVAHLVIVLGALRFGLLTRWTRTSDISYGVYIYGWPTQQLIVSLLDGTGIVVLLSLSFLIVPILGYLSWHIIEKPALALKDKLYSFVNIASGKIPH